MTKMFLHTIPSTWHRWLFCSLFAVTGAPVTAQQLNNNQVKTSKGILEGVVETAGVRAFKGIPFAPHHP
ncbi:hypothetical protein MKQ70_13910 [Chitinophaga sedimenti]|uniref:hypothetical protein n=1 Tax=Chitinophaga sedimenti TaxID=2033606 RepID=UPI0020064A25|nr:hypothetical protein [Chitinophaga sedimenti]MCK7556055.1 hypothetical protein [Chitinophaga sedimenti]